MSPVHPGPQIRTRRDFHIPGSVVWLDTAHQGALPDPARREAERALRWKLDPSSLPDGAFFEVPERLRAALAELISAPPREIVLGNSASFGLQLLAGSLGLGRGDEVLLLRDDFPATVTPWLPLRERGVRVRFLPTRAELTPRVVEDALGPSTRILCTTWIDSFTGTPLDIEGVGRACWSNGTYFVLNATQGLGVRPLSVSSLPVDAISCAGYKWLCGPYGTGFCWIRSDLLNRLRTVRRYWLPSARTLGLDSLERVVDLPPPEGPTRHDVFGTASFLNVLPWTAALEYLGSIGIDSVARHNARLVAMAADVVRREGHRIVSPEGPDPSPILVFDPADDDAGRIVDRLEEAGVHVALRHGLIRVSPHLHNDSDDIQRFAEALSSR